MVIQFSRPPSRNRSNFACFACPEVTRQKEPPRHKLFQRKKKKQNKPIPVARAFCWQFLTAHAQGKWSWSAKKSRRWILTTTTATVIVVTRQVWTCLGWCCCACVRNQPRPTNTSAPLGKCEWFYCHFDPVRVLFCFLFLRVLISRACLGCATFQVCEFIGKLLQSK